MIRRFATQLAMLTAPLIALTFVSAHGANGSAAKSTFVLRAAVSPDKVRDAQPLDAQPIVDPPKKGAATMKIVDRRSQATPATATAPAEDSPLAGSPILHVPAAPQRADQPQVSAVPENTPAASANQPATQISAKISPPTDASDRNAPQSQPFTMVISKPQRFATAPALQVIAPVRIEYLGKDPVKIAPAPRRLPADAKPRLAKAGHERPTASLLPQPVVRASTLLTDDVQLQVPYNTRDKTAGSPTQANKSVDLQPMIHAARQHTNYGFGLASRGAVYSANEQFARALTLVAQGLDARNGSSVHGQALASALTALEEANDFAPVANSAGLEPDIQQLIVDHKTRLLDKSELASIPPMRALGRYYAYAGQELAKAGGNVKTAARAMYGMGRVYAYLAEHGGLNDSYSASKATMFYRVALEVDPSNQSAANELGVMLALYGQWDDAQQVLEKSVRIAPRPTTARNLATVLQQRGDGHRAARVWRLHHKLAASPQPAGAHKSGVSPENPVRWVAHHEFSRTSRSTADGRLVADTLPASQDRQPVATGQDKPPKRPFFSPFAKKLFPRKNK